MSSPETTGKTSYKFSVKANQSLTTGTIGFEGYLASDKPITDDDALNLLRGIERCEEKFEAAGYLVAKTSPTSIKKPSGNNGK